MAVDPREKKAYLNASPQQREVVRRSLLNVLAVLRAQALGYQTSHWQVVGSAFYSDHELFERLYLSVLDQIDKLAEKMVGYLGHDVVDLGAQMKVMSAYLDRWGTIHCNHRRGIQSEEDLQTSVKMAYDSIKGVGAMTLGLDDWLMATANSHEENTYLLQQSLAKPREAPEPPDMVPHDVAIPILDPARAANGAPVAPSAEGAFLLPESSEVREFAESGGITNVPEVAAKAAPELNISPAIAISEAEAGPPTPTEIEEGPGGEEVSTLNRFVVDSEVPETAAAASGNRDLMASWLREVSASEIHYSGPSGPLGWDERRKEFDIEMSSLPRSTRLSQGVKVYSPRKTFMEFTNPIPYTDREGEVTHWVLTGQKGLTLKIWND